MAIVNGGYGSGTWAEAAWGRSVYYPLISNGGWGNGQWGQAGWGLGDGGLVTVSGAASASLTSVRAVAETAVINALPSATKSMPVAVADSVLSSDIVVGGFGAAVYVTESIAASDFALTAAAFNTNIATTIIAADQTASLPEYSCRISETNQISSAIYSGVELGAAIVETSMLLDSANVVRITVAEITEAADSSSIISTIANCAVLITNNVSAADKTASQANVTSLVAVSAVMSDKVNRRLLWEPIDTGVDEDWTLINTNL